MMPRNLMLSVWYTQLKLIFIGDIMNKFTRFSIYFEFIGWNLFENIWWFIAQNIRNWSGSFIFKSTN